MQSAEILFVDPQTLRPAKSNYRRRIDDSKLDELADSLTNAGMLEPMLVRPVVANATDPDQDDDGNVLEVVFGSRRHKASLKAKLSTVPVMVRPMTDDEVLEAQLAENMQREDVYPIDEADGFKALLDRNYTEASIAAKIGRPTRYVVERLKLCTLSKACRKALDDELISLGVALLLAKLPTHKLQDDGLEEVADSHNDGLVRVEEARRRLEQHVMCNLANAPFDRTSLTLLPAAGACTTCPKRTGTQVELFPDASSPDLCTDPPCFKKKNDAHWAVLQKTAKKDGIELLTDKVAKEVTHHRGGGTGLRSLNETVYPPNGKGKPLRELFKKGELPPVAVGRNPDTGVIVEAISAKDAERAIAAFEKRPVEKNAGKSKKHPSQLKEEARAKREKALRRAMVETVVGFAKMLRKVEAPLLQVLVLGAIESTWNDTHVEIVRRLKLETEADKTERRGAGEILCGYVEAGLGFGELIGLLLELLTGRGNSWQDKDDSYNGRTGSGLLAMRLLGIKREVVQKHVDAELALKEKAKAPTKPTKPTKPAAAKGAPKAKKAPAKKPAKRKAKK